MPIFKREITLKILSQGEEEMRFFARPWLFLTQDSERSGYLPPLSANSQGPEVGKRPRTRIDV